MLNRREEKARHTESYYAATAHPAPDHPALQEDLACDICVIGGGITGCSTALALAERGYDVVLLEAERIGWGASGRSGGQLIFGYGCEMGTLRAAVGADDARALWELSLAAVEHTRATIARHDIACDLGRGHMHVAIKPRQQRELTAWQRELEDTYGYQSLALFAGPDLRAMLDSPRYVAGLLDTNSGHLHPLNYTLGLARAAAAAGVRIFEGSRVQSIQARPTPTVRTPAARVRSRTLVLCTNAYVGGLVPSMRARIMPVGSYIAATEPLGELRARALIRDDFAVADVNFVLDYFRLSADRRLLFGGRVSYSSMTPPRLTRSLRKRMSAVFPQLRDVDIEYTWGGNVAITMNRAPNLGRLDNDVYFAQGFSGHGIGLTGFSGAVMAEAIAGTTEKLDVFARIPHRRFPGGTLMRTPALVLAMLYYRLRDLL